jgi:hypothetical protein
LVGLQNLREETSTHTCPYRPTGRTRSIPERGEKDTNSVFWLCNGPDEGQPKTYLLDIVRSRDEDDDFHSAFARRAVRARDWTDMDLVLILERRSFVRFEPFIYR